MGDATHKIYVERFRNGFRGPFLEVGSRDYGDTQDLRPLFPGETYVGVDMLQGKGVDLVLDMAGPFEEVDAALGGRRFGTVFCLSVLEHCEQPFRMADNITRLLKEGGKVYVSAPFAWKFHGYPSDYWRFTHEGIKKLFPRLEFDPERCFARTASLGDLQPLDDDLLRLRIKGSWHRRRGRFFRGLGADLLRIGPFRWLTKHRYLHPPTAVEMTGTLRDHGAYVKNASR